MAELVNRDEFPQLTIPSRDVITYMDNAGAALYNRSHIDHFAAQMKQTFLSNPHSGADDASFRV